MGYNIVLPLIKIIIHVINVIVMIVMIVMIVRNVIVIVLIVLIVLVIITKEGELAASDLGFTTVGFEPLHFAAGGNGDLRAAAMIF